MNFEETFRSNDKLIRKFLHQELPDLNISPAVKLAIMEHVNKKRSRNGAILLVAGIAASLLLVFFLGRTSNLENNLEISNPTQIVNEKKERKHFYEKYDSPNPKYTPIAKTQLNKIPPDNLSVTQSPIYSPQLNCDTATTISKSNLVHDTIYIQLDPVRSYDSVCLAMIEDLNNLEKEYQNERNSSVVNKQEIYPSLINEEQFDTLLFDSLKQGMEILEKEMFDSRQSMIL